MSDRDFSIGQKNFKLNKLDAFKQFHIVRRVGPMLSQILPAMKDMGKLQNAASLPENEKLDALAAIVTPIMEGFAKLSDADSEMVLLGLLSSVEMQQQPAGNWARLASPSGMMFSDLELSVLLNAAARAFMYNLSNFFAGLPQ